MAAAPQQQPGQADNSLGPIWIIAGIFVFAGAIWYFAHAYIVAFFFKIKLFEIDIIKIFNLDAQTITQTIQSRDPADVSFNELLEICGKVGDYLRYPFSIILIGLGFIIYFNHGNLRFKKTYSMEHLIHEEKGNWPQITPVSKLDLVNTDIDKGPWAMALTPMQFAKKYQLLQIEKIPTKGVFIKQKIKNTAVLRRDIALKVIRFQLGPYWKGIDALDAPTKALFTVFATRANRDRENSTKLLLAMSASAEQGQVDFTGVDVLLKKSINNKAVQAAIAHHGYVYTVMAEMLLLAREDGVLPTSDFIWLKPINRRLWFMLNSVGRQTPYSEVCGPFCHWIAERTVGHLLKVPMIDEAVKALEIAIQETVYIEDEEEITTDQALSK